MAKQVPWNKIILEEFIRIGNLDEIEEMVIRTRVANWTRTKQCAEIGVSMATLDRIIKRLKCKYDLCQKYSPILPPRKFSVQETYMDLF